MTASQASTIVVMGVAGCGKSTVAALLADRLGLGAAGGETALHPRAPQRRAHERRRAARRRRPCSLARGHRGPRPRDGAAVGKPLVVAAVALAPALTGDVLRGKGVVFAHLSARANCSRVASPRAAATS
ncbi:hypothetical protein ACU4GD_45380 [Cupriavidus basilensis]